MSSLFLIVVLSFLASALKGTADVLNGLPSSSFVIDIDEHGHSFQQRVTNAFQLQVYEVPKHGDFEEIVVYLDFANHFELIKRIEAKECELSVLDPSVYHSHVQPTVRQAEPFRAAEIPVSVHPKLIIDRPMASISHLRKELRDACNGWPVFWADNGLADGEQMAAGFVTVNNTQYFVGGTKSSGGWSCSNISPGPPQINPGTLHEGYACHPSCQYQMCYPNMQWNCYYLIVCGPSDSMTAACIKHITNPLGYCRLCCTDSRFSCNNTWKVKYCGCPNINEGASFHG